MSILVDNTGRPRTVWRLIVFVLGLVAVNLGLGIVLGLGLAVYLIASGVEPSSLGEAIKGARRLILYVSAVPVAALTLGLAMVCRRFLDRRPIWSMGLVRPASCWSAPVPTGLALGLLPIMGAAAILFASGGLLWQGGDAVWEPLLLLPVLAAAAFAEEIAYRGYVLQNFIDVRRPFLGVTITSILFWVTHSFNENVWSSPLNGLNLFLAGVLLALAYQVSGNIWFPTALHFGWNYAQGAILGLPISGEKVYGFLQSKPQASSPAWMTGGAFGLEGSVLATAGQLGVIALFLWLARRRGAAGCPAAPNDPQQLEPGSG